MARKRIEGVEVLTSWGDVDKALRDIGMSEIALNEIEGEMNTEINDIKEKANVKAQIHKDKIAEKETLIKDFVTSHKSEIEGKTKTLTFGQTGFRASESISIPRGKAKIDAIIQSLRKNKMDDCIKVEESINKDVLKKYDESLIVKVGASVKKKDAFWYETNLDSVR